MELYFIIAVITAFLFGMALAILNTRFYTTSDGNCRKVRLLRISIVLLFICTIFCGGAEVWRMLNDEHWIWKIFLCIFAVGVSGCILSSLGYSVICPDSFSSFDLFAEKIGRRSKRQIVATNTALLSGWLAFSIALIWMTGYFSMVMLLLAALLTIVTAVILALVCATVLFIIYVIHHLIEWINKG